MNRIDKRFKALKQKNELAFIPFVTAGDYGLETTEKIVEIFIKNGADIIELGIPHSDPIADGPVIEKASMRALGNGVKIDEVMSLVKKMRTKYETPLLFMMYYNCILRNGEKEFLKKCSEAGIDGLIVPDLPFEESESLVAKANEFDIHIITFIAPTSEGRLGKVVKSAKGFLYCVSSLGVTGARSQFADSLYNMLEEIPSYRDIPRAVGFGISKPEQIEGLKGKCEAVIVGSAIVKIVEQYGDSNELEKKMGAYISAMKRSC